MSKLNLSNDEEIQLNQMLLAAIPHPAMLVRIRDRVVLAANKVALDYGVKIGGQCWRDLGKKEFLSEKHKEIVNNYQEKIPIEFGIKCTFCQADDCFSQDPKQNNPNIEALGKIWDIHWIKITDEIFLHYVIDITEHKKREEELMLKNIILSTQLDTSLEGILVIDDEGKVISYNRRFYELWGLEEEYLAEASDPDLLERVKDKIIDKETFLNRIHHLYAHKDENSYDEIRLTDGRIFERYSAPLLEPNRKYHGRVWYFTDVTERYRTEQVLRLSEEKYSALIKYSNDPIFCFNPDETYRYVNEAFAKPFGKSPEEIIGKTPHSIFTFEEAEKRLLLVRKVLKTGEKGEIEVCVDNLETGETKYYLTMVDPVKDVKGNVLWVSCISKDITERKLSETVLRESESLKNQLLQTTDQGIYGIDLNGLCTFINKSGLDMIGYDLEECIGQNMHYLIHHSYSNSLPYPIDECPIFRAKESGESCKILDEVLWRRDGTSFPAEYSSHPNIENGKIRGAVVTFTDITIRKNAEKALLDVIDKNPISIQVVDKHGYVIKVNTAHTKLFGAVPPVDYTIFEDFQIKQQGYIELFDRVKVGEVVTFPDIFFNAHNVNPDFPDVPVWVRMVVFPINDSSGKPDRYVTMQEDITERKKAEDALKAKTALLEAQMNATIDGILVIEKNRDRSIFNKRIIELFDIPKNIIKNTDDKVILNHIINLTKNPQIFINKVKYLNEHPNEITRNEIELNNGMILDSYSAPVLSSDGECYGRIWLFRDITDRKLSEIELELSKFRLELAQQSAGAGTWDWDLISQKMIWSKEFFNILGLDPEKDEANFYTWQQVIHVDDLEYVTKQIHTSISNKTALSIEFRVIHSDGQTHWVIALGKATYSSNDTPVRMTGICIDITKRKQIEESLLESEERLSEAQKMAQIGTWDWNIVTGSVKWSNEVFNIFHLDPHTFTPQIDSIMSLSPWPEEQDRDKELIQKALQSRKKGSYEQKFLRPDNSIGYYFSTFQGKYDNQGNLIKIIGTVQDITERKKAEEKLKQQSNAMEAATVGIAILDNNSNYVYLNNAHIKVYGYSSLDELIGKSWKILYYSDELQRFEKKIMPELFLKGYWHGEAIGKKKDGTTFPQELSLTTLKNGEIICIVRDITDRKLAEEALRESEEKYRIIIENSHDIIYTLTEEGVFLYTSPSWTVLLGHSTEEVIGSNFQKYVHPDDVPVCYEFLNKIKKSAQRQEGVEYRVKHLDGSWRWHTTSGVPLKDNNGKISRLVGIARDITERKNVEETLTKEKQFSKSLLDSLPGIFYLYTYPEKELILWNKQHELLLGFKPNEMINRSIYDWHRPEDRDAVTAAVDKVMDQGHSELEAMLVTKDKKIIPFLLTGVRFESHNEKYLMGIGIDMSDRKKAEEELQRSEARYRSILDASPDDITITDLEGRIQMISPKALTLFKYEKEEDIIGHNVIDFLIPEDRERAASRVALMFKGIMTGPGEYQGLRSDGGIIYLETNGEFIKDAKGNPTNIVFVIRDISERKLMEATIVEKERLSAIGELASGIAHDFNNSLQAIVGNIELAFLSSDISDEIREYLKIIQSTTIDATARVRQLQRFARKEKESTFRIIDLNAILDESIEQTRPKWKDETEKKGIKISFKKQYKAKGLIEGNIGELRSAFYNLINNAIEAMPKGGLISIQTEDFDKEVLIRIIDTGIGMDQEMTKRIFQPFFTTKGFELGRGLGLSSVYSVIRDHRGNIYVKDTVVGKGTTFEIMLPKVEQVNIDIMSEKHIKKSTLTQAKILWVDDEHAIRQLGKRLLTKLGHQAEIADGGIEALKLLKESHFDILITDVGMPGMSGWQLAESIKGKYPLKVAVVTGWGADIPDEEKLKYGIDYIIGKPINISELKDLINTALEDLYK